MRPGFAVCFLLALLLAGTASARNYIWIDERGVTHITNDVAHVPVEVFNEPPGPDELETLWEGPLGAEPAARSDSRPTDHAEERTLRLVRGAVADLQRGENARAAAALNSILRDQPSRPEPHWYLALLDRHRGRYDSAESHLTIFLATAGDDLQDWRASAERRLAALADERRLADAVMSSTDTPWPQLKSSSFRVHIDPELERSSARYAGTVLRYLEEARRSAAKRLGVEPDEPMGVVFYGRAAYDNAHRHRFSFRTVGFFDGRIHVVSAAHPAGELRALLFHEYSHAVFRERTGGDRPYWLNEGLAELAERESRKTPGLTRSERRLLKRRIDGGSWIDLERLAPSFAGLDDEDARAAYLEATAAAAWIESRTDTVARGRLLERLGSGISGDEALTELLGLETTQVDHALRRWIRSEFPGRLPRPAALRAE